MVNLASIEAVICNDTQYPGFRKCLDRMKCGESGKWKPVCGTDGQTYCNIKILECLNLCRPLRSEFKIFW